MIGKKTYREICEELAAAYSEADEQWLADRLKDADRKPEENRRAIETLRFLRDSLAAKSFVASTDDLDRK